MIPLPLHDFHQQLNARSFDLEGMEAVRDYGNPQAEHHAFLTTAGIVDFSFRGRLCLSGADRVRFLHGQVTNDVKRLKEGAGCYAALVNSKGKMQSDLNIYCLQDELLLDFEPGLVQLVTQRLEKYIVADDVQVVDVAPHYGLLSVQGPAAEPLLRQALALEALPSAPLLFHKSTDPERGEMYVMNQPRLRTAGFDLFVPLTSLAAVAESLMSAAKTCGAVPSGWLAFETARVEAGIPRFGADMDESTLPLESGIEARAVSYSKGCYVGQEIINRIHTIGHVNRQLAGLRFADPLQTLPAKGEKLFHAGKQAGHVTSAVQSFALNTPIALGYVRREVNRIGTELTLGSGDQECTATIAELPFVKSSHRGCA
jgi:folate-binding protein YgfZ